MKQTRDSKYGMKMSNRVRLKFSRKREYRPTPLTGTGVNASSRCLLLSENRLKPLTSQLLLSALKEGLS